MEAENEPLSLSDFNQNHCSLLCTIILKAENLIQIDLVVSEIWARSHMARESQKLGGGRRLFKHARLLEAKYSKLVFATRFGFQGQGSKFDKGHLYIPGITETVRGFQCF